MPNLANSSIRRDTLDTVTAVSGMIWPSSFRGLSSSASLVMLIGVSLDIENYCTVSLFFEQTYL